MNFEQIVIKQVTEWADQHKAIMVYFFAIGEIAGVTYGCYDFLHSSLDHKTITMQEPVNPDFKDSVIEYLLNRGMLVALPMYGYSFHHDYVFVDQDYFFMFRGSRDEAILASLHHGCEFKHVA